MGCIEDCTACRLWYVWGKKDLWAETHSTSNTDLQLTMAAFMCNVPPHEVLQLPFGSCISHLPQKHPKQPCPCCGWLSISNLSRKWVTACWRGLFRWERDVASVVTSCLCVVLRPISSADLQHGSLNQYSGRQHKTVQLKAVYTWWNQTRWGQMELSQVRLDETRPHEHKFHWWC